MRKRSILLGAVPLAGLLIALVLRATTIHSVGPRPLIYRVISNVNDLDGVEGLAPPGRFVELWMKQRNFREGGPDGTETFSWCVWKNHGTPVRLGVVLANDDGTFKMANLRQSGNTVMLFPSAPAEDACVGGIYTELLTRSCAWPGFDCSEWDHPTLNWLNVRRPTPIIGTVAGAVTGAEQTSAAVADGPNDGPEPSDVVDVDQNGIDTTLPGYTVGQKVSWRCGAGGTAVCPSVTIHDSTTAITPDPEYPYVLGTIQAHRAGGSFIAAGAIPRGQPIGFSVNVNVKFRGRLDLNLGCDQAKFFDFSVPATF
jgi:hypothetical protein